MSGRRSIAVVLGVLAGTVMAGLGAAPAAAHAVLRSCDPAPGAVLTARPAAVVCTFSEPVRVVAERVTVVDPTGGRADTGRASADGAVLRIPLRAGGARGTYLVSYRVISGDSHPVAGGVTFSVGAPSAGTGVAGAGTDEPAVGAALRFGMGLARAAAVAGLFLTIGPAVFLLLLWPRRLARRGPARLLFAGLAVAAAGTVAELWLQTPYGTGGGLFDVASPAARATLTSTFGVAHAVRLVALATVPALLRPVLRDPDRRPADPAAGVGELAGERRAGAGQEVGDLGTLDRAVLVAVAVLGLATWPLSGHPGSSPAPAVTTVADMAHLGALGLWLGGLVTLGWYLLRQADGRELGAILPVWSGWARNAVAVVVLAGVAEAVVGVGTPRALVDTWYGRLVLAKVGVLAAVLGVAGYSAALVRRGTPPGSPNLARLRRGVLVELAGAAVVLALAAALVQATPGSARAGTGPADAPGAPVGGQETAMLTSPLYQLQADLAPGRVGPNGLHLYAYTTVGAPLPVVEWSGSADLPAADTGPVEVPLTRLTDNHATAQVTLPQPGIWRLRFTLRTSEVDEATVTWTVRVR